MNFLSKANSTMLIFNIVLGLSMIVMSNLLYEFISEYHHRSDNAIQRGLTMLRNDSINQVENRTEIQTQIQQNAQIYYLQTEVQLINEKLDVLLKTKKKNHEPQKSALCIPD